MKIYKFIVNSKEKQHLYRVITFDAVVILAFGIIERNDYTTYTITWKNGDAGGIMLPTGKVKVKDGMIFNVTRTDKS